MSHFEAAPSSHDSPASDVEGAEPAVGGEPTGSTTGDLTGALGRELALGALREMAVLASNVAFTISDPNSQDNPLVWANPAFTAVTGYQLEEVLGLNCRFLQGADTDPNGVRALREAVRSERSATVTLLNYRKDGSSFWNQVAMSPVRNAEARLIGFVGVQTDVSERVLAEAQREMALAAERVARAEADRASQRVALLAEVTTQLASTLEIDAILDRLAELVVPALADWAVINLFDAHGGAERSISRHGEAALPADDEPSPAELVEAIDRASRLRGAQPVLMVDAAEVEWRLAAGSNRIHDAINAFGVTSALYVPLVAGRQQLLGWMMYFSGPSDRTYHREDLSIAVDLGRRVALTLDNARLYEHDHRVAVTLQRSLLPDLPRIAYVMLAARYLAGDVDADVGGDFYEVLPLPDGSIGVAVGDVLGHDLVAAAAMGHLRGLLRASAWNSVQDGRTDPVDVLDRVDRLVQGLDVVPLATLFYGRLERPGQPGGSWRFTYANAGHPPPMVRGTDGTVVALDDAPGVLLGVTTDTSRCSAVVTLAPGAMLVAFTDGLVERRGEHLSRGLDRVGDILRHQGPEQGPETTADALLESAGTARDDDIAILVLQVLAPGRQMTD